MMTLRNWNLARLWIWGVSIFFCHSVIDGFNFLSTWSSSPSTRSIPAQRRNLSLSRLLLSSIQSNHDDGMREYEVARQAFQDLHELHAVLPPKPLTASAKRVKELELTLLQDLKDSDEAIDALVDLWMRERSDGAAQLLRMQEECSPGCVEEEAQLREMIEHYGSEWIEPMARLAVLTAIKGRHKEAIQLCENVLKIKPWHFEAGYLLVTLHLMQQDFSAGLRIARRYSLPALKSGGSLKQKRSRRMGWVEWATTQAQEQLRQAQLVTAVVVDDEQLDECPVGEEDFCWG